MVDAIITYASFDLILVAISPAGAFLRRVFFLFTLLYLFTFFMGRINMKKKQFRCTILTGLIVTRTIKVSYTSGNRENPYFEKRAITLFEVVILRCILWAFKVEFLERFTDKNKY